MEKGEPDSPVQPSDSSPPPSAFNSPPPSAQPSGPPPSPSTGAAKGYGGRGGGAARGTMFRDTAKTLSFTGEKTPLGDALEALESAKKDSTIWNDKEALEKLYVEARRLGINKFNPQLMNNVRQQIRLLEGYPPLHDGIPSGRIPGGLHAKRQREDEESLSGAKKSQRKIFIF